MSGGNHNVGALGQRVVWKLRVKAEVSGPGGVNHQRNSIRMRYLGQARNVRHGANIRRFANNHGLGIGMLGQGLGQSARPQVFGQAGFWVNLGAHPNGRDTCINQANQHALVQGPRNDYLIAGAGHRHDCRVV